MSGIFIYYLYDHLGNTRVTYSVDIYYDGVVDYPTVDRTVLSATDYYPYGKALRSYGQERYQSTYHERDVESGFDYRGARFYDSDVGRFNSLDPLAADYPSLSDYSYVAGNPIIFVDPDGKRFDVSIKKDENGNISEINISSTIYIQTDNPSEWEGITNDAKESFSEIFKDGEYEISEGQKISITFDVDFKAVSSIKEDELGKGDNFLIYTPRVRSHIKSSKDLDRSKMGVEGALGNKNHKTIVHETGHFLGLVDRYTDVKKGVSVTHQGWEGNIMASKRGDKLFQSQYDNFGRTII